MDEQRPGEGASGRSGGVDERMERAAEPFLVRRVVPGGEARTDDAPAPPTADERCRDDGGAERPTRSEPRVTAGSLLDPGLDGERVLRWPVVTADGARIGEVGAVRRWFFQVAAARMPHFWLHSDDVASTLGGRVTLAIATDALDEAKLDDETVRRRERDRREQEDAPVGLDLAAFARLRRGWPIYARDGEKVGDVETVSGRSIKVDPAVGPDYWLAGDVVHAVAGGQVTLTVTKDELDDYKQRAPTRDHEREP